VTSSSESKPRAPLSTIQQNHIPSTNSFEDIEDAEIIVVDTPEKPIESLEDQFTQVEDEFHESKSTMDIDSDDDPTTEPEDDSDSEQTTSSKRLCVPSTTKLDREELRVVRNNFAEEYDPWDTSMVPEYAEDIFRYMRELEVHSSYSVLMTVPYDS
jgi:G2/mitotic-specific cyclin 2